MNPTDWVFSYNGMTFGAGTGIEVAGLQGLIDLAATRTGDQPRPNAHGLVGGADYLGLRSVTLDLSVTPGLFPTVAAALDAIKTALAPVSDPTALLPLTFKLPGLGQRVIFCRCRKLSFPIDIGFTAGIAIVSAQLDAVDPRIYDGTPTQTSIGLGTGVNQARVNNLGNISVAPVFTIYGPMYEPTLTNLTTGEQITILLGPSAGQVISLDFDAHSILLNGVGGYYSAIATGSTWWKLHPGPSTIQMTTADGLAPGGYAYINWASAWL